MSAPKFTSGPWEVSSCEGGWDCIRRDGWGIIAKLGFNNPDNAYLIASAPELYEALEQCLEDLEIWRGEYGNCPHPHDRCCSTCEAIEKAQKALKSARGGK